MQHLNFVVPYCNYPGPINTNYGRGRQIQIGPGGQSWDRGPGPGTGAGKHKYPVLRCYVMHIDTIFPRYLLYLVHLCLSISNVGLFM